VARRKASPRRVAAPRGPWSVDEVVDLAARHNLVELEVESGGTRIRVVREHAPVTISRQVESRPASEAIATAPTDLVTIEAPMVGTFYRASAPDAAPYVSEGDAIKEGQVLCIIEAMKLMNEIEAKAAGRIERILVENGQPVEYGQALFLVNPRR
jgi:biotin carboxyl carrier protein